jgi:hypothetical protein
MLTRNFFEDRDLFLHLLEMELKRSLRYQSFASVLLIEIPTARRLTLSSTTNPLGRVVASLSSQIRETDIIGTTKENTITVVLLNCDKRGTSEIGNRVSCWLSQYFGLDDSDSSPSGSKLRLGAASFPTHATDSEHLLDAASEMLEMSRQPKSSSGFSLSGQNTK